MPDFKTRVLTIAHLPAGEAIFSEYATTISIDDEAAGEFVVVKQQGDDLEPGTIKIDRYEWPTLRRAINRMIRECEEVTP